MDLVLATLVRSVNPIIGFFIANYHYNPSFRSLGHFKWYISSSFSSLTASPTLLVQRGWQHFLWFLWLSLWFQVRESQSKNHYTGLFTASGHFDTPFISVVDGPILKPFGVVIVITGWFGLVYNNAWQVVRYLCKYCIKFGQILQQMKFPGNPEY